MRYIEVVIDGITIVGENNIKDRLFDKEFYWLIDSEIENSKFEIKKDTLIWYDGVFYTGKWKYGIFKKGTFYGTWENGIFEGGIFKGKWISGINNSQ